MTSKKAKSKLIYYFLQNRYISAITEPALFNNYRADILVLDNKFRSMEVEVKVDLADLMTELRCIQKWKGDIKQSFGAKLSKHNYYLDKQYTDTNKLHVPNKFSFAIAGDFAIKEVENILKDTPYGLYYIQEAIGGEFEPRVIKSAEWLHNNPVEKEFLITNLKRISWENYTLLKNIVEIEDKMKKINDLKN